MSNKQFIQDLKSELFEQKVKSDCSAHLVEANYFISCKVLL